MAWADQFSFVATEPASATLTGDLYDYTEGPADYKVIYVPVGGEGIDDRPIGPAAGKNWTFIVHAMAASFSAKKAAIKTFRDRTHYKGSVTYNLGNKTQEVVPRMRLVNVNVIDEAANPLQYHMELQFLQVTR